MRIANLRQYYFKRYTEKRGSLGSVTEGYGAQPKTIQAYIYPAGGQIQMQQYGQRLGYMLNMMYNCGDIAERDGICVYVKPFDTPDYRVVSIKRYTDHCEAELERIV